jgi:hypothetical protein
VANPTTIQTITPNSSEVVPSFAPSPTERAAIQAITVLGFETLSIIPLINHPKWDPESLSTCTDLLSGWITSLPDKNANRRRYSPPKILSAISK